MPPGQNRVRLVERVEQNRETPVERDCWRGKGHCREWPGRGEVRFPLRPCSVDTECRTVEGAVQVSWAVGSQCTEALEGLWTCPGRTSESDGVGGVRGGTNSLCDSCD